MTSSLEKTHDPRFADIRSRIAEIDELYQRVSEVLEQRATREWLDLLPEKQMPRGVSHDSVRRSVSDPQISDRSESVSTYLPQTERPET